jgi:hypothetical protein
LFTRHRAELQRYAITCLVFVDVILLLFVYVVNVDAGHAVVGRVVGAGLGDGLQVLVAGRGKSALVFQLVAAPEKRNSWNLTF